jgi:hypothetical protein
VVGSDADQALVGAEVMNALGDRRHAPRRGRRVDRLQRARLDGETAYFSSPVFSQLLATDGTPARSAADRALEPTLQRSDFDDAMIVGFADKIDRLRESRTWGAHAPGINRGNSPAVLANPFVRRCHPA